MIELIADEFSNVIDERGCIIWNAIGTKNGSEAKKVFIKIGLASKTQKKEETGRTDQINLFGVVPLGISASWG